jgi:hypothetical protein
VKKQSVQDGVDTHDPPCSQTFIAFDAEGRDSNTVDYTVLESRAPICRPDPQCQQLAPPERHGLDIGKLNTLREKFVCHEWSKS